MNIAKRLYSRAYQKVFQIGHALIAMAEARAYRRGHSRLTQVHQKSALILFFWLPIKESLH